MNHNMLRRPLNFEEIVDEALAHSSYKGNFGSFIFGFASSSIFFIGLLLIIYIIYESIRNQRNYEILTNIYEFMKQPKFILPLYYNKHFRRDFPKEKEEVIPIEPQPSSAGRESKPKEPVICQKPEFVVPALTVDPIGLPLSRSPTPHIKTPMHSYSNTNKDDYAFSTSSSVLSFDYVMEIKRRNVSSNILMNSPTGNSP